MVYPGNESISPEIRKRIVDTFRQTLSLAEKGSRQEALLGCDFILRLDPTFEAARILSKRLEGGESVEIDDLRLSFEAEVEELEPATDEPAPPAVADLVDEPEALGSEEPDLAADELFAPLGDREALAGAEPELDARPPSLDPGAPPAATPQPPAETPQPPAATPQPPAEAPQPPAATPQPPAEAPQPPAETPQTPAATPQPPTTAPPPDAEAEAAPPAESVAEPEAEPEDHPLDLSEPSIDFEAGPSVELDSETQSRIDELLAQGQEEFDRAEHQAAIDAWSRIFLIDIDHAEANRRIDLARKLKAEVERGVEEAMHEGIAALERRDPDGARAAFERILELQPNHPSAADYLRRLDSDEPPFPAEQAEAKPASRGAEAAAPPDAEAEAEGALPTPPPPRAERRPRPAPAGARTMAAATSSTSRSRRFVYLGGAIFLVVAVGAWFLWSRSSSFFPNAQTPEVVEPAPDPIARATELFEQGKQSIAIAQLRRLGPENPAYAEAQALIFQWESGLADLADGESPEAERLEQRQELIQQARGLAALERFVDAEELLTQAGAIAPLDGADAELEESIAERLDPIRTQIEIYQQGEWAMALRDLWRMRENGLADPVVVRLMVDCYYNLGVRDLQRGDTGAAEGRFAEALELGPEDTAELERLRRFSRLYNERQPDLLYRIFVKYLPFR